MTHKLFDEHGRQLPLGKRIGKGGEGEVFEINGSAVLAVKVYTVQNLADREAKIRAMVAERLAKSSSLIAYPAAMVFDERKHFAGFVMRLVAEHRPMHELYAPSSRKQEFPKADYRFLVRSAANAARAVAATHASNCVIGDINHSGLLVSDKATVALIDADSFQVSSGNQTYLCKVGVPEYTPPELQGKSLAVRRTPNHDAFGLAVLCFQLLWMGRHPFAGRFRSGDMPFERAISEFRFAYSAKRSVGMDPPPGVPSLKDFPPNLADAFEEAFGPSGPAKRPTAADWVKLLTELEQKLRSCEAHPRHQYPGTAARCPWCEMERLVGITLFPANQATGTSKGASPNSDWRLIWSSIESIKPPSPGPSGPALPSLSLPASAHLHASSNNNFPRKALGIAIGGAAIFLFSAAPGAAFLWLIALIFGGYLTFSDAPDPLAEEKQKLLREADDLEQRWANALAQWHAYASDESFRETKQRLVKVKTEIENIQQLEATRIKEYEQQRRERQLHQFLDRFRIKNHKITGIGPTRETVLASFGIETAADVSVAALNAVPGFGPVISRPLLEWRRSLETQFSFSAAPSQADAMAINQIRADISQLQKALIQQLARGSSELSNVLSQIEKARRDTPSHLQNLHRQREQIAADLAMMGLPRPSPCQPNVHIQRPPSPTFQTFSTTQTAAPPSHKPAAQSPVTSTTPAASHGKACPSCGKQMVVRIAKKGHRRGNKFYGCSQYPRCTATRPYP